ncbi:2'-5' RNA ligase family protein [Aliikangiella marina]|uniref:2'-5' RNA ligase family protein n=1 Tax=Aliikangiella marina TaxID=1712262 RepID=A0A545T544_9GAMM|nr:2'-5' RNA ligase family protein [Aliikangiella marina]TQV72351.1 2'-5' RNA ligase family protein [Aliikangiella marina]
MSWQKDYQYGTLLLLPPPQVMQIVNSLRQQYDPQSHKICVAHITLTQPLIKEISTDELNLIEKIISQFSQFEIQYGPISNLSQTCIIFQIAPKKVILTLREKLHQTGFFNLNLPFTEGFIPHMTVSEMGIANNDSVIRKLNQKFPVSTYHQEAVTLMKPNHQFVFKTVRNFNLKR